MSKVVRPRFGSRRQETDRAKTKGTANSSVMSLQLTGVQFLGKKRFTGALRGTIGVSTIGAIPWHLC